MRAQSVSYVKNDLPHGTESEAQATRSLVNNKFAELRRLATKLETGEAVVEKDMLSILQSVLELHEMTIAHVGARDLVDERLLAEGVRVTKNTSNEFIPLMKLVSKNLPKSTIGRSASILRYASYNEIKPADVRDFIKDSGGIVKCSELSREFFRPEARQRSAEKIDTKLSSLRDCCVEFQDSELAAHIPEGVWSCLIEKRGDRIVLLSLKSETSFSGYSKMIKM